MSGEVKLWALIQTSPSWARCGWSWQLLTSMNWCVGSSQVWARFLVGTLTLSNRGGPENTALGNMGGQETTLGNGGGPGSSIIADCGSRKLCIRWLWGPETLNLGNCWGPGNLTLGDCESGIMVNSTLVDFGSPGSSASSDCGPRTQDLRWA